jgi:hypothetical protein
MNAAQIVGFIYGILSGLLAYFLFGFHLWQSIAIAWLIGSLFAFLTAIFCVLREVQGRDQNV